MVRKANRAKEKYVKKPTQEFSEGNRKPFFSVTLLRIL